MQQSGRSDSGIFTPPASKPQDPVKLNHVYELKWVTEDGRVMEQEICFVETHRSDLFPPPSLWKRLGTTWGCFCFVRRPLV